MNNLICKGLFVVLEHPNYIINIGHVIRNANAFGVEKLLIIDSYNRIDDNTQHLKSRKSILKHSASAVKWIDIITFKSTNDCIDYIKQLQYFSFATSPHQIGKKNIPLDEAKFASKNNVALWFGSEANGLTNEAISFCDMCIQIPLYGKTESFNLASATAITLYEASKQRKHLYSK